MKKILKRALSMMLSGIMVMSSFSGTFVAQAAESNEITISAQQITGKSSNGHGAQLAVDGSLETYYQSPELSTQIDHMRYVDIELDGVYDISEIKIYNIEGSYNHYQIYASETGTAFDKVAYKDNDEMPNAEKGDSYTFETPVRASALRINLSYNSSGQQANLAEVKLFGEKVSDLIEAEETEIAVADFADTDWKTKWDKFENDAAYAKEKTEQEMSNLVGRVIGEEWMDDFVFEQKVYPSENDTYEVEQGEDGKIVIRGNNGIAMASGFNHYLKYYCNVVYDPLFVSNLEMPEVLPEVEEKIVKETQYDVRYALNFCTYSYTMAFWDWGEYEAFLDWAAMSGINLMLDIVGQEEIIRRVFTEYGYTNDEIKEYIVGPGYFAWYYMQNMTSWGGPLPDNWFEERVELGRKMHDRMQVYGIRPVLSGFSGMVPLDFDERFTDATIVAQGKWSEFARPDMLRVYVDGGKRDYFAELADVYYEAQKAVFGDITDYYSVDPFHEGGKTGDMNLTTVYSTVQNKLLEHDPNGVWVIQQWSGALNDAKLSGLTKKENALILDLSSEYNSYASRMEKNEVPWVWNMLHAFGGKPGMEANVGTISQKIPEAFENYNYMAGIGVTPESFSRCPMIYDMLWEMTWTKDPIDPMEWGRNFLQRRYGAVNDDLEEAWALLLQTAYDCRINDIAGSLTNVRPRETFTSTSGGGRTNITYDVKEFEKVLKIYVDNYEQFKDSECYVYDLVDIARQVLSNSSLDYHKLLLNAYYEGDVEAFETYSTHFLELIQLQNDILATSDHFQVGNWINMARTMLDGADDWTKDLFEFNARCLITTWGGQQTDLVDYSYRGWAGITEDYYLKRWSMWVDSYKEALLNGTALKSINWFNFEWEWVNRKSDEGYGYPTESTTKDQVYEIASDIYDSYTVTNLGKIADEIPEAAANNLLEGKVFNTGNVISAEALQSLTDGDAGTGWMGQTSDWPVVLTHEFDSIVDIEEVNVTLKSLVVGGIPVTYKVEVWQDNAWKLLTEDLSGSIEGQFSVACEESIEKIRFTFDSVSEEEVPELKEISVLGTVNENAYENLAAGLTATSSSILDRPVSYLTDNDLSTVFFANNGNSKATITLPLGDVETVEYIELYMEKAGLRFKFDVYGKNTGGTEELLFSKGATGADMPYMYRIPVGKDLTEIRIQYVGRDSGGQFYAAAFGFAEIKVFKKSDSLVNAVKGIVPEVSSAFSDRPAVCLTDGDLNTRWLTNGNNPATVKLALNETAYVEFIELYMEKAGMRFKFDVYATNADGEEELIFQKGATGTDMPAKYTLPVGKEISAVRIEYIGRDTGGQFYLAGFGFSEIRVMKRIVESDADAVVITNIAENGVAVSKNLTTNEVSDASAIIDGDLTTRKEYIGEKYAFVPAEYTVELPDPAFVESLTTYFEKAGLRFKFKIEVEDKDGNMRTVLDMLNNAGDMAASYSVNINDTIKKVVITMKERCADGQFYAAGNMIYEVEILGRANSVADQASAVSEDGLDMSALTDGNKETKVLFEDGSSKAVTFTFEKPIDIASMNIFTDSYGDGLKYKVSYKGEDAKWYEAVDNSANISGRSYYKDEFAKAILTDTLRVEILNEGSVSLKEVEIYKQSYAGDVVRYINTLTGLTSGITYGPYVGNYDEEAYHQFMDTADEVRLSSVMCNSKEIENMKSKLYRSYMNLISTYVSIDRSGLLDALLEAKALLANEAVTDKAALEAAVSASGGVYDTYKVTQPELDDAERLLREALQEVNKNLVFEIVTQPEDVAAKKGTDVSVSVEATGQGLTYKWYYKNPGNWKFYESGTEFVSEDGAAYTIPMAAWRDGQEVYCVVTDKDGNTLQSNTVTLSMDNGTIQIIKQPESVIVDTMGDEAVVTVEATGEGLTYQWFYKNPGNVKFYASGTDFVSEDGASYSISVAKWRDGQEVYCVITDANGDSVQTNTVTLSVAK